MRPDLFALTTNPRHRMALEELAAVYAKYDLTGGCLIVDEREASYRYLFVTTWNAFIEDLTTPLGVRIRVRTAEQGRERAQAWMEGTAWVLGALRDFARQTETWMGDMMQMLRRNGVKLTYTPHGGARLPRLTSQRAGMEGHKP